MLGADYMRQDLDTHLDCTVCKQLSVQGSSSRNLDTILDSTVGKRLAVQGSSRQDLDTLLDSTVGKQCSVQSPSILVTHIYEWIAKSITYDLERYEKRKNIPHDVIPDVTVPEQKTIPQDCVTRKMLCTGFAELFFHVCRSVNVPCVMIPGHVKGADYIPGDTFNQNIPNHVWNAVYIDNTWKLVDVTWAVGHVDSKSGTFRTEFTTHYLFTSPEHFILDHRPLASKWQLLDDIVSMENFIQRPKCGPKLLECCFLKNGQPDCNVSLNDSEMIFNLYPKRRTGSATFHGILRETNSLVSLPNDLITFRNATIPEPVTTVCVYIPFPGSFVVEIYLRDKQTTYNLLSFNVHMNQQTGSLPNIPTDFILFQDFPIASPLVGINLSRELINIGRHRINVSATGTLTDKTIKLRMFRVVKLALTPAQVDISRTIQSCGFTLNLHIDVTGVYKLVIYGKQDSIRFRRLCTLILHLSESEKY